MVLSASPLQGQRVHGCHCLSFPGRQGSARAAQQQHKGSTRAAQEQHKDSARAAQRQRKGTARAAHEQRKGSAALALPLRCPAGGAAHGQRMGSARARVCAAPLPIRCTGFVFPLGVLCRCSCTAPGWPLQVERSSGRLCRGMAGAGNVQGNRKAEILQKQTRGSGLAEPTQAGNVINYTQRCPCVAARVGPQQSKCWFGGWCGYVANPWCRVVIGGKVVRCLFMHMLVRWAWFGRDVGRHN